jgi:hydroxymethylpyrimidine pyrophosphatase-like HAD family hydrolase
MPKLLAIDLDGTLCRRDGTIDPRDRAAIQRAVAQGITVGLVTGRLSAGTLPVAQDLGLDGLHACADGSVIISSPSGRVLEHHALNGPECGLLRELIAAVPGPTFLLTDTAVLHDELGVPLLPYMSTWSPDLRPVDNVFEHPIWRSGGPTNTVTVGPREHIDRVINALRAETELALLDFDTLAHPGIAVLVARPAGENKGAGISRLAARAGCSLAQVVAVGDWLNDRPMFQVAGRSFAVPGCPESLRELATDLLESPGGHGAVAEAIARTWGIEP